MKDARELVPKHLMKQLLCLERKLLMTLFSRKHPPKGMLLLELWTTDNGFMYLRYVATGSLNMTAVNETCPWRHNMVINDCIANDSDIEKSKKQVEVQDILQQLQQ